MILNVPCYYCGMNTRTTNSLAAVDWFMRLFRGCDGKPFGFTSYVHFKCYKPLLEKLAQRQGKYV